MPCLLHDSLSHKAVEFPYYYFFTTTYVHTYIPAMSFAIVGLTMVQVVHFYQYTPTYTVEPHKRRQCIRCCLRVSSECSPDVEVQVVHVYQYTPTYTMEPPQKATMYQMLLKSKLGMFPRCGGTSGTRLPVHSYLHSGTPTKGDNVSDVA